MAELLKAEICLRCDTCGRQLRATLQDVRRRRTVHCPAGHRTELGLSDDWLRPQEQLPSTAPR